MSLYKGPPPKASAGELETLLLIVALATAWHVGLALLERHLRPKQDRPSLARLLLLAEVDVLRTLRAELRRWGRRRREGRCEQKLSQVEEKLKELGEDEAGSDF